MVKNLSFRVDENQLRSHFSSYGKITNISLVRSVDGKSKGFGFIEFASHKSAQEALDNENEAELDGRALNLSFSRGKPMNSGAGQGGFRNNNNVVSGGEGSTTVFVGNLAYGTNEDGVRKAFSKFGAISDIRIHRDEEGKSRYAHVEFEEADGASTAS